jgi:hypothetical protein
MGWSMAMDGSSGAGTAIEVEHRAKSIRCMLINRSRVCHRKAYTQCQYRCKALKEDERHDCEEEESRCCCLSRHRPS